MKMSVVVLWTATTCGPVGGLHRFVFLCRAVVESTVLRLKTHVLHHNVIVEYFGMSKFPFHQHSGWISPFPWMVWWGNKLISEAVGKAVIMTEGLCCRVKPHYLCLKSCGQADPGSTLVWVYILFVTRATGSYYGAKALGFEAVNYHLADVTRCGGHMCVTSRLWCRGHYGCHRKTWSGG
jgi:hypothetical protein